MKRAYVVLFAVTVLFQTGTLFAGHPHDEGVETDASAEAAETQNYICPMHPDVQSDKPGECSKCGMTLKQAAHDEMSGEDSHKGHTHKHH